MLQQHLYVQTGLLSIPRKALLAGRMLMTIAYPLSRAGTNCPNRKAITRAAPLLSNEPCCRRLFKNRDSRNRVPVIPVTKPASSNAHIHKKIQLHMTHSQSIHMAPLHVLTVRSGIQVMSHAVASVCGLIKESAHAMLQVMCLTECLTRCPVGIMLLHLSGPVQLTCF